MSFEKPTNFVEIIGLLSENNIEEKTYTKNGENVPYLGGTVKVKVIQKIGSEDKVLEIPVRVFAKKYTNSGDSNPAFASWNEVMKMTSIAAAGGEEGADAVRVTGALSLNEYYGRDDKVVSFPIIRGSFIKKIRKDEMNQTATFRIEGMVRSKMPEVNRDGEETGRLRVNLCIPQYGGIVDELPFFVESPKAIDFIEENWRSQDTVPVKGKLNFSTTTQTRVFESAFGEPEERSYTTSISELIITGGDFPLEEGGYSVADIKAGIEKRLVNLENSKKKKAAPRKVSAPSKTNSDFGF